MGALDELMRPPDNPATPYNQGVRNVLHELFVQPVKQAGDALRGRMTDAEAQDFAFGAAAGLIPMGRGLKAAKGIRAYHGSPHDFDRFDMSKIGTGEGAQAYGHGLYFAENPAVAQEYRRSLTPAADSPHQWLSDAIREAGEGGAAKWLDTKHQEMYRSGFGGQLEAAAIRKALDMLNTGQKASPKGRMYEVNINAHPDQFLDWDKPLSKQPGEVKNALANLGIKHDPVASREFDDALLAALQGDANVTLPPQPRNPMGSELYRKSGSVFESSSDPYRSAAFREAGIPGIKYLDQGSRTAGEGSRNYVVFDDKLIDIVRKYGLVGLMSGTAVGASKGPLEQLMTAE